MLETYLSSVIIWMIIIFSLSVIFTDRIAENGWIIKQNKRVHLPFSLFIMSAVPILRLGFAFAIIYMATVTKEEFDRKINEG